VPHDVSLLPCRAFDGGSSAGRSCRIPNGDRAASGSTWNKFFTYATPHNGNRPGGRQHPELADGQTCTISIATTWRSTSRSIRRSSRRQARGLDARGRRCRRGRSFCWSERRNGLRARDGVVGAFAGHAATARAHRERHRLQRGRRRTRNPTAKAFVYRSHSGYSASSQARRHTRTRAFLSASFASTSGRIETLQLRQPCGRMPQGKKVDALYQVEGARRAARQDVVPDADGFAEKDRGVPRQRDSSPIAREAAPVDRPSLGRSKTVSHGTSMSYIVHRRASACPTMSGRPLWTSYYEAALPVFTTPCSCRAPPSEGRVECGK